MPAKSLILEKMERSMKTLRAELLRKMQVRN
jgi:hypothetical protein